MAKIRKRTWTNKDGKQEAWIVDYKDQLGARHIETHPTRKKADEARRKIEGDVDRGVHTPANASLTVSEAGEAWIKQAETDGLERSTVRQYRQHLDLHIVPLLGNAKLAQLTVATIKTFRNDLIAAGRSRDMAKRVVTSLGGILADAQTARQVARNVVREHAQENRTQTRRHRLIEKRHEQEIKEGVDYPTKPELHAMLQVPGRWHVLVVTAVFSGLRASELRGLTWDHVDLHNGIIQVRQRADRWNELGDVKSSSAKRDVTILPYAVNTLKEWKLACPKSDLDLVFPNNIGGIENLPNIHRRGLGPLQFAAGITTAAEWLAKNPRMTERRAKAEARRHPKYGLHSLRHTAASLWAERGYSPKKVQTLMGHSTIAMTLDIYTHLWKSHDQEDPTMAQLEAAIGLNRA